MAPNPFSDLTVDISADTADFQFGINRAKSALSDLSGDAISTAGSLQVLQGRTDEAGDEMGQLSRRSTAATAGISSVGASAASTATTLTGLNAITSTLTFSMSSLANTPLLIALPALTAGATALLSTLFPLAAVIGTLTAGAGALAAAFGAVVGSGILAFGEKRGEQNAERLAEIQRQIQSLEALEEQTGSLTSKQETRLENLQEEANTLEEQTGIMGGLQSALSDLGDELAPIITQFGEAFIPLIEDALDGFPDLVEAVLDAVGGLEVFQETLRELGEDAADALPGIAAGVVDLAEEALPPFLDLVDWLGENGESIFRGMLRVTQRLAPTLLSFGRSFARVTPEITRLGTYVLETLVPAFTGFLQTIQDLVNTAQATTGLSGFVSALTKDAFQWLESDGIALAEEAISGLVDASVESLKEISENVDFEQAIIDLIGDFAAAAEGTNTDRVTQQVLGPILGALGDAFAALADIVSSDEYRKQAEVFSAKLTSFAISALEVVGGALGEYVTSDQFKDDMSGFGQGIINVMVALIEGIGGEVWKELKEASLALGRDIGDWVEDGAEEAFNWVPELPGIGDIGAQEAESLADAASGVRAPGSIGGRDVTAGERNIIRGFARREESPGGSRITRGEAETIANALSGSLDIENDSFTITDDGEIVAEFDARIKQNNRQQGRDAQARRTNL